MKLSKLQEIEKKYEEYSSVALTKWSEYKENVTSDGIEKYKELDELVDFTYEFGLLLELAKEVIDRREE